MRWLIIALVFISCHTLELSKELGGGFNTLCTPSRAGEFQLSSSGVFVRHSEGAELADELQITADAIGYRVGYRPGTDPDPDNNVYIGRYADGSNGPYSQGAGEPYLRFDTANHWVRGDAYVTDQNVSLVDTTPAFSFEAVGSFSPIVPIRDRGLFYFDSAAVQTVRYHVDSGGYYWADYWGTPALEALCVGRGHVPLRDYGPGITTLEYRIPSPPRLVDNDSISYRVIEEEKQATYNCQRCHKEYTITVPALIDTIWKR